MQQHGFCCKDCVPGLVLQIVQETERNIEIGSNRPNDFDYRDAELDEDNEKRYLKDFKEYEQDMTTLRLSAMTPALLLFNFKGKKSAVCKRCGGTPLLMHVWHWRKSCEQGLLCHSCAFNLCGTILGSCIENDEEAVRREEAEANENAQDWSRLGNSQLPT